MRSQTNTNVRKYLPILLLLIIDTTVLYVIDMPAVVDLWSKIVTYTVVAGVVLSLWFPGLARKRTIVNVIFAAGILFLQTSTLLIVNYMSPSSAEIMSVLLIVSITVLSVAVAYLVAEHFNIFRYAALKSSSAEDERNHFPIFATAIMVFILNYLALIYFNTLLWPQFWPRALMVTLAIGFVMVMWYPDFLRSIWMFRIIGFILFFVGESYLLHSFTVVFTDFTLQSIMHFIGFGGMYTTILLNYFNQMRPKSNTEPAPLPAELPYVAAVVPTYDEPYQILEQTLLALTELDYPKDRLRIIISDDGHRPQIRALANSLGVLYNEGARKNAKAGNLNSALAFISEVFPQAQLILTQDADEIVASSFLMKTVGYFNDPGIGFIQTPKEAITPSNDPFGTRDRIFYDNMQVGRNGWGAAFACGSGVIWRIEALIGIGGFSTWNLVEDLTTSYTLHAAGWRSEYHNEVLSVGLAPDDIPGLLKQRGTWAVDNWRLFLFDNPLFKKGLTPAQKAQYVELGLFYTTSTIFTPLLMLTPIVSIFTGHFIPIEGSALAPWVIICVLYYLSLSRGRGMYLLRMWQYWIGFWPMYTQALFIALGSRNKIPKYKVTSKVRQNGFYGKMIWLQYAYMVAGIVAILYATFGLQAVAWSTRLANVSVLILFLVLMSGICKASFYGLSTPRLLQSLRAQIFSRGTKSENAGNQATQPVNQMAGR